MSAGVLFDLDGTLADTAPDLAAALNRVLTTQGRQALPYAEIRPHVSHGAAALIQLGFAMDQQHPEFGPLRERLLNSYQLSICRDTQLFPGILELLNWLQQHNTPWGIVTNKPGHLTQALLQRLNLPNPPASVISGDTLAVRKPDPQPLLLACEQMGVDPTLSVYIGDAERDMQAANAAGMCSVLAAYGYLAVNDQPETWQADAMIEHSDQLLAWCQHWQASA